MIAGHKKLLLILSALAICGVMLGCAASVGTTSGGGAFVSLTIGGKTVTFTFGPAGVIQTRANQTVSQGGALTLMDSPPTDRPATGQMTLLSNNCSVTPLPAAKGMVNQQADPLNGSAVVTFSAASAGSADPCANGTLLAQFNLNVTNGQVTVEDEDADLSWAALQAVFESSITMCIEVWSDFDGQLTMSGASFKFGTDQRTGGGVSGGLLQVPIDSSGNAIAGTTTAQGVSFAPVSVISVSSPGSPQPVGPGSVTVDLAELGLEYVQTVCLGTQSVYTFDIPAVRVATFVCEYADGGAPTRLELILGSNTAEHAWEDPDAAVNFGGPPPHNMPPLVSTLTVTNDAGTPYPQHSYYAEVSLDASRTLSRMSLELVDVNTIIPLHSDVVTTPEWLAQINLATTLEGPPASDEPDDDDGHGDDVTAEKIPAQVVLTATVLDNAGDAVSGQVVDMVAEKWTADGPVPDRRFELSCVTGDTGQCSQQMGFNLGGPTGEFVRFTATVTADGTTDSEYADFHIDPTGSPDVEQWLTETVTIRLGTGGDDGTGGTYTASDLAGCWRVTVTESGEDGIESLIMIHEIDSTGKLASLWVEFEEDEDGTMVTKTLELARFTSPNAGLLGAFISNLQQSVSINADGTADISWSLDLTIDEDQPPGKISLNIDNAVLSGDPPTSFTSDTVSGETDDSTFVPPANGQKTACPNGAEEDVITQEEFEADFDLDICGAGTALMLPLMFLALGWMKWRR